MKTRLVFITVWVALASALFCSLQANNIQIPKQPTLETISGKDGYYAIQFDLKWDNSWKSSNPRNWDAAWVFVKYNLGGDEWKHVYLEDTNGLAHKADGGVTAANNGGTQANTTIEYVIEHGRSFVPALGKEKVVGIFLHRKKNGYGSISFSNMQLMWNYTEQGIASDDPVTVKVFALEMVYVPEGQFFLGAGGSENYSFRKSFANEPFKVTSEDSIWFVKNTKAGKDGKDSSGLSTTQDWNISGHHDAYISAEFPKGYQGFYVMKYEITQEAWVDYLNCLDIAQQAARQSMGLAVANVGKYLYDLVNYRCGVILHELSGVATFACNLTNDGNLPKNVNQAADGQNIAMNYISTQDWLSYLAWSGLRPLSEMEYEKACRGSDGQKNPIPAVAGEYVWGTDKYLTCSTPLSTASDRGEAIERPNQGNVNISATPLRVGAFADSASSRYQAGASYWGIMELAGNVAERYVNVETLAGRKYKGTHGYGNVLPLNGAAPADLEWPADGNGYIFRGGYLNGYDWLMRISDRVFNGSNGSYPVDHSRSFYTGGRGARTAAK